MATASASERSESPASPSPVAVVTGGSRGIGRAVVESLLDRGWRVFFCSRDPRSVERALGELAGRGGALAGRPVDVRRQEEVDAFVAWVLGEAGRIDCLVSNAGVGIFGPVDGLSGDDFRAVVETNLLGPFYFLRAVAPAMKRQGAGWIVHVASLAGKNAMAGGAAYNASKFGLVGLSEAAMLDLRQHGVRVAAVLPGSVSTGFSHPSGAGSEDWRLTPEDVARAILDLLDYPARALPSLLELRPSRPPKR